jgi:hypothetical protein
MPSRADVGLRVLPGRVWTPAGDLASAQALPVTLGLYALAFLLPAWPWLSGAVAIPWDAESQFRPQVAFLARALATGQSPFWTPNVFAGWPQISDPQALIFSPLHFLLAWCDSAPSGLAVDRVTFAYLFLGGLGVILYFRDRGWHPAGALVAALAFAFGGSANSRLQHTIQIISLCYLALALWLLARALDRGSWRWGAAAGLVGGLLAVDRDHVALLSLYVLAGVVVAYLLPASRVRLRASRKPLAAAIAVAGMVAAVPVTMTALLAARSNRPEIAFALAEHGSLHPVDLLMLAFADLFHAMAPNIAFWGPPSPLWHKAFGSTGLWTSKNMGMVYSGAVPLVALASFGLVRGHAWSSEIRVFTIAAAAAMLYALGWYTPAFHAMYELMPGIDFFRRPADATFVLGGLLAIMAGYCVDRWLAGAVAAPTPRQRAIEVATAVALVASAIALAGLVVSAREALRPVVTGLVGAAAAIAALALARACNRRAPFAAAVVLAAAMAVDFAWNDAPHISTGLPPATFAALEPDTADATVRLIKARLAADAAPDRRDRLEMINIAYHWQNLSLAQDFDHVFGHNPLRLRWFYEATHVGDYIALASQRVFSPLYPSYRSTFADLLGVRLIVTGVPVDVIDKSLRAGDLDLVARTKDAYVYENPRALPRVMVVGNWQLADFKRLYATGWPTAVDPRETLLLARAPKGAPSRLRRRRGSARILRYENGKVDIVADAPDGGFLLLTDVWHPWWRATLDGRPADILRADVIFRAVALPPGTHQIRFTFEPFTGALAELAQRIWLER